MQFLGTALLCPQECLYIHVTSIETIDTNSQEYTVDHRLLNIVSFWPLTYNALTITIKIIFSNFLTTVTILWKSFISINLVGDRKVNKEILGSSLPILLLRFTDLFFPYFDNSMKSCFTISWHKTKRCREIAHWSTVYYTPVKWGLMV